MLAYHLTKIDLTSPTCLMSSVPIRLYSPTFVRVRTYLLRLRPDQIQDAKSALVVLAAIWGPNTNLRLNQDELKSFL